MRYEKPEIVSCNPAIATIQSGSNPKQLDVIDSTKATDPAYEADE
jgi:hypothetical protein